MNPFDSVPLQDGEEVVFGIATSTSSSLSTSTVNGVTVENTGSSSQRKSGVTNRRVIVESGASVTTIPNSDVQRVWIKRDDFMGQVQLTLEAVEAASGQKVELGIGFLEADDEALIQATFPGATITSAAMGGTTNAPQLLRDRPKKKGIFAFLGFGD
ncbi:hypothetical protein IAD21_05032 [Abditibacteriota bacterium]|nr:hypothetical protein IAD21_05032 [Abditibacteriota bacterium]